VTLLILIPVTLFAEEVVAVAPVIADPTGIIAMIKAAPWYGIAVMVVGAMKFLTPFIPDAFMDKYPPLKYLNTAFNWLALNVFNDKNEKKKV